MTNPDNAVGTNAAYSGRTSVDAFNDGLSAYSRGILTGWACEPSSELTVTLGGDGETRDVAIAEDNVGNKTTINNISQSPVEVTISAAPATNTRIDVIVAYVDNPPSGSSTITDNYEACGLIVVEGTADSSPSAPDEDDIRAAITADGATGSTAYYVVLATITIAAGTTDLTSSEIEAGDSAAIGAQNIDFATFADYSTSEVSTGAKWIDGETIYKKTISFDIPSSGTDVTVEHDISNFGLLIKYDGVCERTSGQNYRPIPAFYIGEGGSTSGHIQEHYSISLYEVNDTDIWLVYGNQLRGKNCYITLYYTKSS